jgi:hypothetical protein
MVFLILGAAAVTDERMAVGTSPAGIANMTG